MKNNWEKVKLEEVLEHRKERPDPDKILLGEIPIVAKIGFDTGKIELRKESKTKTNMILIKPGDLVISGINAAKGAIAVYNEKNKTNAAATIHYSSYKINNQKADKQYLWYFLRSNNFKKILIDSLPGGIKTEVRPKRLLPIDILLPPLEEQKRIVDKIEKMMTRVEEARRFRSRGIEDGRNTLKAIKNKVFSTLDHYPREIITKVAPINGTNIKCSNPKNWDLPYISLSNVESNTGNLVDINTVKREGIIGTAVMFDKNHVLYAKLRPYLNKVVLPSFKGCGTTELVVLEPNKDILSREFLAEYLRNPLFVNNAVENSSGTKMPRTMMKWFRSVQVPLPSIEEQKRIVSYLNALQLKLDKLKKLQEETEKELEQLPPSILNKAFNGEL